MNRFANLSDAIKSLPIGQLIVVLLTLFVTSNSATALSKSAAGWKLSQSSTLIGDISSKMTQEAIRIDFKDLDLTIICKAPNWSSTVYRPKYHELYNLTYRDLIELLLLLRVNKNCNPNVTMETNLYPSDLLIAGMRTHDGVITRKDSTVKGAPCKIGEFWVTPDINVPRKIVNIYGALLMLRGLEGLPLRYCYYKKAETATVFDTTNIVACSLRDSDFRFPGKYKDGGKVSDLLAELFGKRFSF